VAILDEPLETMDRAIREDILVWIERILASGAAVVIATHQIEPFVGKAARAIAFRHGGWRLVEPLPGDPLQRMSVLEYVLRHPPWAGGSVGQSRRTVDAHWRSV
jgi:energy-coupling factor transporter ATP-binding protein EcfA2